MTEQNFYVDTPWGWRDRVCLGRLSNSEGEVTDV